MAEEHTYTLTKKYDSTANHKLRKLTKANLTTFVSQSKLITPLGHILAVFCSLGAAIITASGSSLPRWMESQTYSVFNYLKREDTLPQEIIILAIDDQSISLPRQYYKSDSQKYSQLEPLTSYPFKREAYAQAIDKLVDAGVRHIGLDVVFDQPSSYGKEDDLRLLSTLKRYGEKVTLAALYQNSQTPQGPILQLTQPQQMFITGSVSVGTVNFPLEIDGKIHRLASSFNKQLSENDLAIEVIPAFDEAVLNASDINHTRNRDKYWLNPSKKYQSSFRRRGDRINFYGPAQTFETIPFWYLFDSQNWNSYLQKGKVFQDKIVLIGATAKLANDYHPVAISSSLLFPEKMAGVEIHANAIATLLEGKTIGSAFSSSLANGALVLFVVGGVILIITRSKRGINRFFYSIILATAWGGFCFTFLITTKLILPTAVPTLAIATIGFFYLGTDFAKELFRKSQLVDIFRKYSNNHVVREILSQQQDLKDLIEQRQIEISGKILDFRYKIVQVLGAGGFSETYIAEDTKRPGNPLCVVKQLKPASYRFQQLKVARRLFSAEAKTLEKLGYHNQIPQLLAYFEEEEEFYLVQEYIVGHPLSHEMTSGRKMDEVSVIHILRDLLKTLAFVHANEVIHRDIKPNNIIRRNSDGKLVLIDFGAVKEVSAQQLESQEQTSFTIGIGTKGYAPNEQCFGNPHFSSDIYAVGMISVKAFTGISPHEVKKGDNGEFNWNNDISINPKLAKIINKMILNNYQERYQSASEALIDLEELVSLLDIDTQEHLNSELPDTFTLDKHNDITTPWLETSEENLDYDSPTSILPEDESIED